MSTNKEEAFLQDFQVILKPSLQNYLEILKKCFHGTICIRLKYSTTQLCCVFLAKRKKIPSQKTWLLQCPEAMLPGYHHSSRLGILTRTLIKCLLTHFVNVFFWTASLSSGNEKQQYNIKHQNNKRTRCEHRKICEQTRFKHHEKYTQTRFKHHWIYTQTYWKLWANKKQISWKLWGTMY